MVSYPFHLVDVFSSQPFRGNPLAVVHHAQTLDETAMKRIASWLHLSETVFLLPPTQADADYQMRIFTANGTELPFAGHPTLGACHAWLQTGAQPQHAGKIVQQCKVGLVEIRQMNPAYRSFAAPPIQRTPLAKADLELICRALDLDRTQVVDHQRLDAGRPYNALLLNSAQTVLNVIPNLQMLGEAGLDVGLIGPHENIAENADSPQFEIRFFAPVMGVAEDPITGSLNASLAQWLIATQQAPAHYLAAQGTVLGRTGRIYIQQDDADQVWVGGHTTTCSEGNLQL